VITQKLHTDDFKVYVLNSKCIEHCNIKDINNGDGWWYHPKHVEQFPDKINCVTLHLVGYILEY
jgi:hypothetical protein